MEKRLITEEEYIDNIKGSDKQITESLAIIRAFSDEEKQKNCKLCTMLLEQCFQMLLNQNKIKGYLFRDYGTTIETDN